MLQHTLTIARFTLLEGLRARLLRSAAVLLTAVLLAGWFAGELAITESPRIRATLLAALLRPATLFLLSLYIISSMAREFNDKGVELVLALDLPRASYVAGKLAGFALLGALLAIAAGALVFAVAPLQPAAAWTVSLLLELWLVAAVSLFCAVNFAQVVPAACFVTGFYLLGRNIAALQLLNASPLLDAAAWPHRLMSGMIDAIALLLPRLDSFTQSAWLAGYFPGWAVLPPLLAQSVVYIALLACAAMFDFYRRNF